MRFTEAIQSGVVSLIPNEYVHARPVGLKDFLVDGPADVISAVMKLSTMSVEDKTDIINQQEAALRKVVDFSPGHKVDMIEDFARKG